MNNYKLFLLVGFFRVEWEVCVEMWCGDLGEKMAAVYDQRKGWRGRKMDARLNMSGMTEHVRNYDEKIPPWPPFVNVGNDTAGILGEGRVGERVGVQVEGVMAGLDPSGASG